MMITHRHRFLLMILATAVLFCCGTDIQAETTIIKVSLITPEGSTWTNYLYKLAEELKQKTNGEVEFKIYAGGISGDELDVLRKMRINRIHAAGFSGVGLGVLVPKVRILEAPLLFNSYQEIDWVREALIDEFAADFEKKGYVLLGFADAGFVYFFSKVRMSGSKGLNSVKMWVWKGDPVAKHSLEAFGIKAYPLHLTDVNTGLETGMIDSFYAPPLAAIVFQWYSKIRYMLDYPMVNSNGALLMKKKIFDSLSKKNQLILRELARKLSDELVQLARKQHAEALEVLKETGIIFETPTKAQIDFLRERAQTVYEKNMDLLYTRDLFQKVQTILKANRDSHE
jgi:TRAP-type C4-dicarboxylate transport system substrate-binding protein